jgi:hypothetical protein
LPGRADLIRAATERRRGVQRVVLEALRLTLDGGTLVAPVLPRIERLLRRRRAGLGAPNARLLAERRRRRNRVVALGFGEVDGRIGRRGVAAVHEVPHVAGVRVVVIRRGLFVGGTPVKRGIVVVLLCGRCLLA